MSILKPPPLPTTLSPDVLIAAKTAEDGLLPKVVSAVHPVHGQQKARGPICVEVVVEGEAERSTAWRKGILGVHGALHRVVPVAALGVDYFAVPRAGGVVGPGEEGRLEDDARRTGHLEVARPPVAQIAPLKVAVQRL